MIKFHHQKDKNELEYRNIRKKLIIKSYYSVYLYDCE